MIRFTAWLSEAEREGIRQVAAEHGTTQNYVVRVALRAALGLPVPTFSLAQAAPPRDTPERIAS